MIFPEEEKYDFTMFQLLSNIWDLSFLRTIYESNWAKKYNKAIDASTSIYFGFGLLQKEDKLLAVI